MSILSTAKLEILTKVVNVIAEIQRQPALFNSVLENVQNHINYLFCAELNVRFKN